MGRLKLPTEQEIEDHNNFVKSRGIRPITLVSSLVFGIPLKYRGRAEMRIHDTERNLAIIRGINPKYTHQVLEFYNYRLNLSASSEARVA